MCAREPWPFADGQFEFAQDEELPRVGPIFNSKSCGACHFQPALGGSGGFINDIQAKIDAAKQKIASGQVKVSETPKQ